jgi:ribosomal protein L17
MKRQAMRSTHQQKSRERSKTVNTVASKMKQVVDKLIQLQKAGEVHPRMTVFVYKSQQTEITNAFLGEVQKENATLFNDRTSFFNLVMTHYDDFTARKSSYTTPLPWHAGTNPLEPSSGA